MRLSQALLSMRRLRGTRWISNHGFIRADYGDRPCPLVALSRELGHWISDRVDVGGASEEIGLPYDLANEIARGADHGLKKGKGEKGERHNRIRRLLFLLLQAPTR